ncbi:hypothetical protein ACHQM5_028116 [Ranunculus cassubicifolius]
MAPPPPRRKKWTEEEERTLIEKYGEMVSNGTLIKMKTREKKFRPIAAQKIKKPQQQILMIDANDDHHKEEIMEEFDWVEGITHWSNFLRYKNVFGDLPLGGFGNSNESHELIRSDNFGVGMDMVDYARLEDGFGVGENGILEIGYYDGEDVENAEINGGNGSNVRDDGGEDGMEYEEVFASSSQLKKKRKKLKGMEKRAWMYFGNQFAEIREREGLYEDREVERERKRQRREQVWARLEDERNRKMEEREKEREEKERARESMRREMNREWEIVEKEGIERERRRREEELSRERDWENRMEQRRLEWTSRIDGMLSQHRAAMDEVQSRILHDQQNLTNQLLGILSQWTGHSSGIPDHTGAGNPYLSQMIQNLHHMGGMVHSEENRVEEDNHDDQFIVDD